MQCHRSSGATRNTTCRRPIGSPWCTTSTTPPFTSSSPPLMTWSARGVVRRRGGIRGVAGDPPWLACTRPSPRPWWSVGHRGQHHLHCHLLPLHRSLTSISTRLTAFKTRLQDNFLHRVCWPFTLTWAKLRPELAASRRRFRWLQYHLCVGHVKE